MEVAAAVIWIITLAIIVFGLTPPLLILCLRLITAARNIDRLFRETLQAAAGVAGATQHIGALRDTIATARAMLPVAESIHQHSQAIEQVLTDRLKGAR
jgi:hypothetical protein